MIPLTFTLKNTLDFNVNCSALTPNNLAGKTHAQILEITLNNNTKVIDLFDLTGENNAHIIFKKSVAALDYIGQKMTSGQITIEGNCGDFLGSQMRGGIIICSGNAGDRVGNFMRRGLILIDGNAGDYAASRMVAGTIGVYGSVGKYVGFGMKRGTVLLNRKTDFHVTIQDCGTHNLPFLALLFQSFKPFTTKFNQVKTKRARRCAGDLACNGNGEILVLIT